jgi:transcriptional regulator with XRE-family HTH domain
MSLHQSLFVDIALPSMNMDPGRWASRVAAVVRAEMDTQHRSGRDLAGQLGVTVATLSTRLSGDKAFDLTELDQVAAWLGLSASELLARADELGPDQR